MIFFTNKIHNFYRLKWKVVNFSTEAWEAFQHLQAASMLINSIKVNALDDLSAEFITYFIYANGECYFKIRSDKVEFPVILTTYVRCGEFIWEKNILLETVGQFVKLSGNLMDAFNLPREDDTVEFDFVFNIRKWAPLQQTLSSLSSMSLFNWVNYSNVLDYYEIAHRYNAVELEQKCLSLILLDFQKVKLTKKWVQRNRKLLLNILKITFQFPMNIREEDFIIGTDLDSERSFLSEDSEEGL